MEKKDIYEHLAKIYLDASSKKKKKHRKDSKFIRNSALISIPALAVLSVLTYNIIQNNRNSRFEVALYLQNEAVKINFNFDPAKKEMYDLKLNQLNLSAYKALAFSVKKTDVTENVNLKVEFTTRFKEKSEIYIKNISNQWKEYKLPFTEFKKILDWSDMAGLSFTVEEWNAKGKKGVLYVDNVKFLR
ncbi:MAG: hypothetical protein NTY47_07450 [Candidatus Omnitrophica bacterium]|nr:hypothetical protein [Candidatus Omnitrophota bacterium]